LACTKTVVCHVTTERILPECGGRFRWSVAGVVLLALAAQALVAQPAARGLAHVDDDPALAALIARATTASPLLRATAARTAAARARIGPAGGRPDPMLMSGLQSFPIFTPGFTDEMTMKMVGVSQTVLFPGKQRTRREVAERDADVVIAVDRVARAELVAAVKDAWYELAYLDAALELTRQQRSVLDGVAAVALARYDAGAGSQADVITARIDVAKLHDDEIGLQAERTSSVATLNAMLDRTSDTPVGTVTISARLRRAAIPDTLMSQRSPLPALSDLQMRAAQASPTLISNQREIDAQVHRVALARVEARPDFDVVVQYGQRNRLPDMLTLQVAIPLRLQQRTKRDQLITAERAEVAALEAEHDTQRNAVHATLAARLTSAERARARLALYQASVMPQRRAAVDAALASYRANSGTLSQVLSAESALLSDTMTAARALSDFAKSVAALELVVGSEVLP
jgi:outer membrane protein, heavy metal efflux system